MKYRLLIQLFLIQIFCGIISAQRSDRLQATQFLSEFLSIPSVTGNEKSAGIFLTDYCRSKGLHLTMFSEEDSSYNFAASLYPLSQKKPNIILESHIDVVMVEDINRWDFPPFSGAISNGKIYGRGAIDAKGLMAMQLLALVRFKDSLDNNHLDFPYNITLLAVSGEELGGETGTQYILDKHWDSLNAAVVFGEGGAGIPNMISKDTTHMLFGISVAEKSNIWIELKTQKFKDSHGAAPPSLYANKKLIKVLIRIMNEKKTPRFDEVTRNMFKALSQSERGISKIMIRHINWDIFRPFVKKYFNEGELLHPFIFNTYAITHIGNPEGSPNQIASEATAILDCRLLPNVNHEKFIKKIERLAEPRMKTTIITESPDAPPSTQDVYYQKMEDAILTTYKNAQVVPILLPVSTDNNYYRLKGVNVFGIIPACLNMEELSGVHGSNEHIRINAFMEGIQTFNIFFSLLGK